VRLSIWGFLILFGIGAAGGLVGDAGNVSSQATVYLDHSVPFIWKSPIWFPVMVGLGTVAVGLVRLRLGPTRPGFDLRLAVGAGAAVVGIYSITSLAGDDGVAAVALVTTLAVITACLLADGPGLICGLAAALVGPVVEIVIVELDLSEYTALNNSLFGVGLWLPGLYFAFGVAVARITELLAARESGRSRPA
jgi:hypothetical protein